MTGSQVDHTQDKATCLKLISLGYTRSNRVRLYGKEVQLVSDPFPHREGGIAVEVLQGNESSARTIKLPLSVLQVAGRTERSAARKTVLGRLSLAFSNSDQDRSRSCSADDPPLDRQLSSLPKRFSQKDNPPA